LTATQLTISVLRDICDELTNSANDVDLKTNAARLGSHFDKWLFADPRPGETRQRLVVDREFQTLFEALVMSAPGKESRTQRVELLNLPWKYLPVHTALKNSFLYLNDLIRDKFAGLMEIDSYNLLVAILNVLETAFICVWSKITEEAFAFQVFGCLNARGVPLSEADKIKSELFTCAPKSKHKIIESKWRDLRKLAPNSDVGEFLRRQYIGQIGPCTKAAVFSNVRDSQIHPKSNCIDVIVTEWTENASLVKKLLTGSTSYSAATSELLRTVFNILGIQLAWIPILAAANKYADTNPTLLFEFVRMTTNYCFRERTIRKQDTPVIEATLGTVSRMITASKSLAEIKDFFSRSSQDAQFKLAFETATEKRVDVQFYILYQIEKHLSGASGLVPHPHSPKQHIEHILPQRFSNSDKRKNEWSWARGQQILHRELLNRIGNLCILEADINRDVSNYSFESKQSASYPISGAALKKGYKDSVLNMARELIDSNLYPTWSKEMIEKRQKILADYALSTWAF
jgi:Protein of unknown function (DUF1524)